MWTQQRLDLLKKTLAAGLNDTEFALFIEVCKRRQLDPFSKQIYGIVRGGKLVIQTSIDGYRLIAERSGRYLGQTEPYWCGEDGQWTDVWTKKTPPLAAKVGVYKQGHGVPTWGIAYWATYGGTSPFWQKGGPHQLSKCAEALALKKAFPEELSGLYTDDEMAQADNTMVTMAAPVQAADEPTMIFPTQVLKTWQDQAWDKYAMVEDSEKRQWLFKGEHFPLIDKAMTDSSCLIVTCVVESNIRVVTTVGV